MAITEQNGSLLHYYFSFISEIFTWFMTACLLCILVFTITVLVVRRWIRNRAPHLRPYLQVNRKGKRTLTVGFFHPYCNAGGGGERVLWVAIRSLQEKYPDIRCVVYTGDIDATSGEIIQKARDRFNITLPAPVEFVFLYKRRWVEAVKYPVFTLLGQSLGSVLLGLEALVSFVPDIYIDSMGYAFTIPLFKYFGDCKVGCYVHYPTISTDMLERVSQRVQSHNNASVISKSPLLSFFKLQYYKSFAYLYGIMGKRNQVVMVNSSWTSAHIKQLWQTGSNTHILFPPCDISEFVKIPLNETIASSTKNIVSIAQFRPEKDHMLQLKAFHEFLEKKTDKERCTFKLLLVGSCRNTGDKDRVTELKNFCQTLNIQDQVEFKLNVSFQDLKDIMAQSVVGLHTMWNEHFGIGVVELMAAGTVVLAHNSGGPKLDIVVSHNGQRTGYLADSVETYAKALEDIFNLTPQERFKIRLNAREFVEKFSEKEFENGFISVMEPLIQNVK